MFEHSEARSAAPSKSISPLKAIMSRLAVAGSITIHRRPAKRKIDFCSLSHSMLPLLELGDELLRLRAFFGSSSTGSAAFRSVQQITSFASRHQRVAVDDSEGES
jgi:hypothetical protein